KGYQISQYELPIVAGGAVDIVVGEQPKTVRLTRAHLEEDAGKSLHEDFAGMTGIDLNRAGTPLLEIVTEPEMRSAAEAVAYAKALHGLVVWLGICDGNMQEGSFRCDANVSVRKAGAALGTRCEIKNLNSFRFMEQAIEFEAKRQIELIEDGGKVVQETRLYDPDRNETRAMRSKEDAQDYRYFPDPDLLPLVVTEKMIDDVRQTMPELPETKRQSYVEKKIPAHAAALLTSSRDVSQYFDSVIDALVGKKSQELIPSAANTVVGDVSASLGDTGESFSASRVTPQDVADLQMRIADGTISGKISKDLIKAKFEGEKDSIDALIEKRGLKQISDAGEIERLVDAAIAAGAKQVEDYRAGKEKALQSLVGQVMKASKGKANPAQVNEILRKRLAH
ncbi:MAG TPA: Asp-tRNA(Asn)/Glu-tRNA(Gln) amidotransferase subunit GatB, partial [Burkholderiales bacterium]|nr:Asp-tRNA(Asn)/Glu-tRNA(Gln) amidotransferase subunit GatB [Burkholderiales bacterium]